MSFKTGDIIKVLKEIDGGWWHGELKGAQGWFPSNYVRKLGNFFLKLLIFLVSSSRSADTSHLLSFQQEVRFIQVSFNLSTDCATYPRGRIETDSRFKFTHEAFAAECGCFIEIVAIGSLTSSCLVRSCQNCQCFWIRYHK